MAVKITSTRDVKNDGVKALIYGRAGIGKTSQFATVESPIILSAEAGLLSLKDHDIPVITIDTVQDVYEAYDFLTESAEAKQYGTIGLDSITEIAEVLLSSLKKSTGDARQAYGNLSDDMGGLIRAFRDIKGKDVLFSAKQTRVTDDDTGVTSYFAAMPGKTLLNGLPFFFDEVLYMTLEQDSEGIDQRVIKTSTEFGHDAKDRSGALAAIERPDMGYIFDKIKNGGKKKAKAST